MKLVVIESPYAGDVERNLRYVRACMKDCLKRGEAPYASHALYTQDGVLSDKKPEERKLGMTAGFYWGDKADLTAIYTDLGCSQGMLDGIKRSIESGRPFEERKLGTDWELEQNIQDAIQHGSDTKMLSLSEEQKVQGKALVDKIVKKQNLFEEVDEAYKLLKDGHTDHVIVEENSAKVVLNTDQSRHDQEETFCRVVMEKIEEQLRSKLNIAEVMAYEDVGCFHFAIIMNEEIGEVPSQKEAQDLAWTILRETFQDKLGKIWLICLTTNEWKTYMDRDLYRWRSGL